MKLCERCMTQMKVEGPPVNYDEYSGWDSWEAVSESNCEFWAHIALRVKMAEVEVAGWDY